MPGLSKFRFNVLSCYDNHHFKRLPMRVFTTILFLAPVAFSHAQTLRVPASSSYQLLNAYSLNQMDVFSFTHNTAALAKQKYFSAGVFGENRFLTEALNYYNLAAAVATPKGNFGLQANYFGFSNFNEYQLGLAYARPVGKNLDLGVQFNYYGYRVPMYAPGAAVTFEVGAIGRLSDVVSAGVQIYNPVGGYLSKKSDEKLSSSYAFGIGYEPTEQVIVSATVEKEEGRKLNVTGGISYQFDRQFFARAGIRTENNMPFGAAGIAFDELRLDISASYHPRLGWSPGLRMIYQPVK